LTPARAAISSTRAPASPLLREFAPRGGQKLLAGGDGVAPLRLWVSSDRLLSISNQTVTTRLVLCCIGSVRGAQRQGLSFEEDAMRV